MPPPETLARKNIDRLLTSAGWIVQDFKHLNLGAGIGVAVREFPTGRGEADYLLFVDRKAAGVIEAKPVGTTLGGVDWQSDKYTIGLPDNLPHYQKPLPIGPGTHMPQCPWLHKSLDFLEFSVTSYVDLASRLSQALNLPA